MTIGAISFQPYVYHVNAISPASMNRLSKISDDVLDKKIDYSGLAEAQNENPLKKGQTLDFQGMLAMQMQRGRNIAAKVMKPVEEALGQQFYQTPQEVTAQLENAAAKAGAADAAQSQEQTDALRAAQTGAADAGSGSAEADISNFRMQQAISAYEMFMTA